MDKINIALVRFVQLCLFVFFLYAGLIYVGMLLLVPLGLFYHLYSFLHFLSGNGVISTVLALTAVGALGHFLSRMPDVIQILVDAGTQLVRLGVDQIQQLNALAKSSS
jgi:hypothetical protein